MNKSYTSSQHADVISTSTAFSIKSTSFACLKQPTSNRLL